MHDPYFHDDTPVLRNKLDIRDQKLFDQAEADYVVYHLKDLALNPVKLPVSPPPKKRTLPSLLFSPAFYQSVPGPSSAAS